MADFVFAGIFAPGALVFADPDGNLIPAASAVVTILDANSDAPTFYTDADKSDTDPDPDLTTDDNGNWGPYFLDPASGYTYSVVDAGGHSHGPYSFTVNEDPAEPTVDPVDYTAQSLTIVSGTPWHNTNPYGVFVRMPVTYTATSGAAAVLQVGIAASSEGSAGPTEVSLAENSLVTTLTHRLFVPPDFWLRADATHAVIAAGDYTPNVA
jgi:hypothetical protein